MTSLFYQRKAESVLLKRKSETFILLIFPNF